MSVAGALGGGDRLDGVHHRNHRNHCIGAGSQRLGHPVEDLLRRQGAGGVMDQHRFGAVLHGGQSGTDGIRPGGPAVDHRQQRAAVRPAPPGSLRRAGAVRHHRPAARCRPGWQRLPRRSRGARASGSVHRPAARRPSACHTPASARNRRRRGSRRSRGAWVQCSCALAYVPAALPLHDPPDELSTADGRSHRWVRPGATWLGVFGQEETPAALCHRGSILLGSQDLVENACSLLFVGLFSQSQF